MKIEKVEILAVIPKYTKNGNTLVLELVCPKMKFIPGEKILITKIEPSDNLPF